MPQESIESNSDPGSLDDNNDITYHDFYIERNRPILIGHSMKLKEEYEPIKEVLGCITYNQHNWKICVDLKMVYLLLGQQSGYTKHPCFLCMWDSHNKANHWVKKDWEPRETLRAGDKNVINKPLAPKDRIILPTQHIKLGLIKQLAKALDKDAECFRDIFQSFPRLSLEKLKAGIFKMRTSYIPWIHLKLMCGGVLLELCRISSVIGKPQTLYKL